MPTLSQIDANRLYTRQDYVKPDERDLYREFCETMHVELSPRNASRRNPRLRNHRSLLATPPLFRRRRRTRRLRQFRTPCSTKPNPKPSAPSNEPAPPPPASSTEASTSSAASKPTAEAGRTLRRQPNWLRIVHPRPTSTSSPNRTPNSSRISTPSSPSSPDWVRIAHSSPDMWRKPRLSRLPIWLRIVHRPHKHPAPPRAPIRSGLIPAKAVRKMPLPVSVAAKRPASPGPSRIATLSGVDTGSNYPYSSVTIPELCL